MFSLRLVSVASNKFTPVQEYLCTDTEEYQDTIGQLNIFFGVQAHSNLLLAMNVCMSLSAFCCSLSL
jgi:hypothetical protein